MKGKKKIQNELLKKNHSEHEWDGITEYKNPDPMWLRITFYITVFFALGYWILFPSWPTPNEKGALNWSSEKQLKDELNEIYKVRAQYQASFDKASFEEIFQDKQMMNFALLSGKSIFANNCAVCHGAGGGGNPGYPNLTAGAWLWGGKLEDIYTTIQYGIRSGHPDARDSQMPAFGKDKMITVENIKLMAQYVMYLAKPSEKISFNLQEAENVFQSNCASCHGSDGKGNYIVGAPNLTDAIWLYGSDYETVYDVIYNGRGGQMPYWKEKLTDSEIRAVSIYVHQLGGGE